MVYKTDGFEKFTTKEQNKLEELPVHHGLSTHVPLTTLDIDLAVKDLLVAVVILMRTLKKGNHTVTHVDIHLFLFLPHI